MFSFSCALWAIFGLFSLLFFVRQPAIFLFTKAKTTQERTPQSSHDIFKTVSIVAQSYGEKPFRPNPGHVSD